MSVEVKTERLKSLDALRGFDMFWICGGEMIIEYFAKYTHWPVFEWMHIQMQHAEWNGFHFYDMIFPLFLFLAGVSLPFSIQRRKDQGQSNRQIHIHLITRCLILIGLGIIYNGGLSFEWPIRFASVLARIGLGWFFASLIVLHFNRRAQIGWFAGILLFYWAIMMLIPVPGFGAGVLTLEGNLEAFIDRILLPGRLYDGVMDPEGILSTIPAISTALLGTFAGYLLTDKSPNLTKYRKWIIILGVGVLLVSLSLLWNMVFPINKKMWTSSFVLCAGGMSMIFLSVFYLIIDVWGYTKWAFPFVVFGMNAIFIYISQSVFGGFSVLNNSIFGGLVHIFPTDAQPLINSITFTFTGWLILYFLYRKKIFFKV